MRAIFLATCFVASVNLLSQDTTVAWLNNIDTATFKIYYKKGSIPKDFYTFVGIDNLSEIVSANKPYRKGCLGSLPGQRLNWLAKDNRGHWVLSVSFGGRAPGTKYLYIDHEKNIYNINGFWFLDDDRNNLTLGGALRKIKSGQYMRIDSDLLGLGE
ncbi:MAG: hypothetical protein ACXVPN_10800 [Bacteroidia bacterium]